MSQEEDDASHQQSGGGGVVMLPPSAPLAPPPTSRDDVMGEGEGDAPPPLPAPVRVRNPPTVADPEKRTRQRNNKRNKQQQQNCWKPLHYNRHKNNNSGNNNTSNNASTKNNNANNKETSDTNQNQKSSNLRGRNAFFVNTTFTMGRKRAMTFPAISKFFLPYKRPRKESIIPPTKFLLGGNISDPLNLNSLHDDDKITDDEKSKSKNTVNELIDTVNTEDCKNKPKDKNEVKKSTDQITTDENSIHNSQPNSRLRVQVIVPPNMFDPLNLLHPLEDRAEYEKQLHSPVKKKSRNRNNRKRKASKALNNSAGSNLDTSGENINESVVIESVVKNLFEKVEDLIDNDKTAESIVMNVENETSIVSNTSSTSAVEGSRDLKLDLSGISTKCNSGNKEASGNQRKIRRMDSMDKIVSPVIPQPGAWMRPHRADRGGQRGNWRGGRGRGRGSNNSSMNSVNSSIDLSVENSIDTSLSVVDVSSQNNTISGNTVSEQLTPGVQSQQQSVSVNVSVSVSDDTVTTDTTNEIIEVKSETDNVKKVENVQEVQKKIEDDKPRLPKFKKEGRKYQYGNYDRYYGYRNLNETMDVRLKVFQMHEHLFKGRDVLDIGCNVGHVALCVARDLGARSVTGIDIDGKLIERAKKNLRQHVALHQRDSVPTSTITSSDNSVDQTDRNQMSDVKITITDTNKPGPSCDKLNSVRKSVKIAKQNKPNKRKKEIVTNNSDSYFPVSFPLLFGPVDILDNKQDENSARFPYNVIFKHANYVLKDESLISAEPAQFDLIMCLSVSKWLHLNFGDSGLKRAFKRMFAQLRPGGKLILEAQNWASYKKRKSLTENIYNNYRSIEFFPCKFRDYLLSPEVGFSQCSVLGVPQHLSKGFRRPVQLFVKGDFTPSQAKWSDTRMPSASHYVLEAGGTQVGRRVYTAPVPAVESGSMFSYWGSTPYSMASHYTANNVFDMSPFYAPGSGSYTPSYSEGHRNVYAPLDSRWSPSTTAGTPSQSPAHQRGGGGDTPNVTPGATPAWTPDPAGGGGPHRHLGARVYATISSGSDSAAGTPFHQSQNSPRYSPNYYYSTGTPGHSNNVYSDHNQEDVTSSNDEQSRDTTPTLTPHHHPISVNNESSSTPTASVENSPSNVRLVDSPPQGGEGDERVVVNGHHHND